MRFGAIASLAASAALGLGALFVARIWLPAHGAKAAVRAVAAAPAPGVPVVLAATPIAYGEKLEAKQLVLSHLPRDAAPVGAFASIDQVLKQDAGGAPVALVAMSPREPVLAAKLSGPGARPTMAALIGENMRAYTIGVTEVAGGGGHVMPGDRVDVVLTRDLTAAGDVEGAPRGRLVSEVVLQNVRILGMDLNVDPASAKPAVARTATLEVSVEDAERLALSAQAGSMSLALRRNGSAAVQPVRAMATADLAPVGAARALRLAGGAPPRASRPARRSPTAPSGSAVVVVHGAERSSVAVPADSAGA